MQSKAIACHPRKTQSSTCLLCGAPDEDISHVYRCPDPGIHLLWGVETAKISKWVADTTQSYRLSEFLKLLQMLWRDQWALGQDAMLNVFLSIRWRETVEGLTGRMSAMTWTRRVLIQIYELMCK